MAYHPNDNQLDLDQTKGPLIGVVINNKDPMQLRRVQVKIEGVMEGNDKDNTPWFRPKTSGAGSRSDYGNFDAIPEINSTVMIELPKGDLKNGIYSAMPDTSVDASQQRLFGEDYPNTYGSCDSSGSFHRVNKTRGYEEDLHASGFYKQIDKEGNLHIFIPKNVILHIGGTAAIKVGGDLAVQVLKMFGVHATGNAGIGTDGTLELLSSGAATFDASGSMIDINSGTTFGTKDAADSVVNNMIPNVDNRQKKMVELQTAVKKSGEVANDAIKAHGDALQGTRT